jgi:hypothetical protein
MQVTSSTESISVSVDSLKVKAIDSDKCDDCIFHSLKNEDDRKTDCHFRKLGKYNCIHGIVYKHAD